MHNNFNKAHTLVRFRFLDFPVPLSPDIYAEAIERMCNRVLAGLPGIRSVYQIGGVSTPGISDIDMVAVFADGVSCPVDPRHGHTGTDSYLFAHHLYGAAIGQMPGILAHSAFHNYRHLAGERLECVEQASQGSAEEDGLLKTQIAQEFLVRMYINMAQRLAYRVVKLRGFFLQVKAIRYDLDFLGVTGGRLAEVTDEFITVRNQWFAAPATTEHLSLLLLEFQSALEEFLARLLSEQPLYLPGARSYTVAPGQTLAVAPRLAWRRWGLALPGWLGVLSPRIINLQNRLNRFEFEVPARTTGLPPLLTSRFALISELRDYNRRHLPHFAVLTSSLNV